MIQDKFGERLRQFVQSDDDYADLLALVNQIIDERTTDIVAQRDKAHYQLQHVNSMLIELDVHGTITFANARTCEITGYSADELLGQNWFTLILPEDERDSLYDGFRNVIQQQTKGNAYDMNHIVTKTGKKRLIGWNNTYQRDPVTGEIIGSLRSGQDITLSQSMLEALELNELRYRQMFNNSHIPKLVIDPKTADIVDANPAACDFYGYSYETLTQMNVKQINTASIDDLIAANAFDPEFVGKLRYVHRLASGEFRDVEIYVGPLSVDDQILRFSLIIDVTEREKAKRALQLRESQFRTALEHLPNSMMIMFDMDLHCIVARGQSLSNDLNTPEELEGKYLPDVLPETIWHNASAIYEQALQGNSTRQNYEHEDRRFILQVEPLYDDNNHIVGGLHLLQDITYFQEAEQLLDDTTEQLNTILNGVVDGVAIISKGEKVLFGNDTIAEILGFDSPHQMIEHMQDGMFIENIPYDEHGKFLEFEDQSLFRALNGETPPPQVVRFHNPRTKQDIWVEMKVKPTFDDDHTVRFIVVIASDITRARQIEQFRLNALQEQAQIETLQKYIANTTHDISQPLSVINTAVYMLEKISDDEILRKRTSTIRAQSIRIQSILQDIREISILDSVAQLDFASVDMNGLFASITDATQSKLAESAQTLIAHNAQGRKKVIGNARYLEKAIKQLIQNAIDYSHTDGQIELRCEAKSGNVIITVIDQGVGIEADQIGSIFERFYRVDESRTTSPTSGTGLGLSIANRIADLHGGNIEVESILGEGSTFRLILPLHMDD